MHLSPEFGLTVRDIEKDGFPISQRVEMLLASDSPEAIAKSLGLGAIGFAQAFAQQRPDILLVLGDRFEMHAAALAALPFKIPVAHLHGGEITEGVIDDSLRHSITKLSHLHLVSTEAYACRVRQMGEEGWRVIVCGAPALDNIATVPLMLKPALENALGFALEKPCLLATFHPATLEFEEAEWKCGELLLAIERLDTQTVFTLPNADTGGRVISKLIKAFVLTHPKARLVENLGTALYFNLMRYVGVMVGNSSSGIIEAPSFGLPVVNIGSRQRGRARGANVIDVTSHCDDITAGIRKALTPEFRATCQEQPNPYSAGKNASAIIVDALKSVPLGEKLAVKKFIDLQAADAMQRMSRPTGAQLS